MQNALDLLTLLELRDALGDHPDALPALKVAIEEYRGRHREPEHVAIANSLMVRPVLAVPPLTILSPLPLAGCLGVRNPEDYTMNFPSVPKNKPPAPVGATRGTKPTSPPSQKKTRTTPH